MGKAAVIVCPAENCKQTFKQEPKFYDHLKNVHSVYDVELYYIDLYHDRKRPVCACDDENCRRPLDWQGWKMGFPSEFVRGHNIKKKDAPLRSKEVSERAAASRIGQVPWNAGKTKENDERLAIAAQNISKGLQKSYDEGRAIPWQLGETKETNDSLRQQSETKKRRFASGEIHSWNEGETKETHPSLLNISEKASERMLESNPNRFSKEEFDGIISSQSIFDLVSSFEDYKNRDDKLKFKCRNCGEEQLKDLKQIRKCPVCFSCHPKGSLWQVEVFEFVKRHCPDTESSNRKVISPLEIDVYVPSKNFGIECNGLFYHCEENPNFSNDHLNKKTNKALASGIRIMHVFEDEWKGNRELVEAMILHRLGLDARKIDARKCDVVSLDVAARRRFFHDNHLDGDVKAKEAWGLLHKGELVAALSVRKANKVYENSLEIARFSNLRRVNVRGGLGKLLKAAEQFAARNGFKSLMTYVDRRIGEGEGYESVGFERKGQTALRFWWTDRKFYRLPRELVKSTRKLDGKSEKQNAEEKGVCRIYGCKNYVFEKNLSL